MNIEGTYTLQAMPEDVWKSLMDRRILRHAIPGLEQLEVQDQNIYTVAMHIERAPLKGSYSGRVRVSDQDYPYQYHISIEGEGQRGPISGECIVRLDGYDENTVVVYKGTLTFGKPDTVLSTPLVKGAIKLLLQQFFLTLADQLRATGPAVDYGAKARHTLPLTEQPQDHSRPHSATADQNTRLHAIVHRLHLGGGDSLAEERWAHNLRRVGITAALLGLVWIGTRLPRR